MSPILVSAFWPRCPSLRFFFKGLGWATLGSGVTPSMPGTSRVIIPSCWYHKLENLCSRFLGYPGIVHFGLSCSLYLRLFKDMRIFWRTCLLWITRPHAAPSQKTSQCDKKRTFSGWAKWDKRLHSIMEALAYHHHHINVHILNINTTLYWNITLSAACYLLLQPSLLMRGLVP